MVKGAGGQSLAVDVYEQLRQDVFLRVLSPGERLLPGELARRFGVSVGVTREALGMLAAKGLVEIERNRGFHVVRISPERLRDLIEARKIVEGAALQMSIAKGSVEWEAEVLATHHRLSGQAIYVEEDGRLRPNEEWVVAHTAFHRKIVEGCGNAVLLEECARLAEAAELYRDWSGALSDEHRDAGVADHLALRDACLSHDAERAIQVFHQHVGRLTDALLGDDANESTSAGVTPTIL